MAEKFKGTRGQTCYLHEADTEMVRQGRWCDKTNFQFRLRSLFQRLSSVEKEKWQPTLSYLAESESIRTEEKTATTASQV